VEPSREELKMIQIFALDEVNQYLVHLPAMDQVLITIARKTWADAKDIVKLLEGHNQKRDRDLSNKYILARAHKFSASEGISGGSHRLSKRFQREDAIIRGAIRFLGDRRDLLTILLVNKKWHGNYRRSVHKLILLESKRHSLGVRCENVWKTLVRLNEVKSFDEMKANAGEISQTLKEAIDAEVRRTLKLESSDAGNPTATSEYLDRAREFLYVYAHHHKETLLSQGVAPFIAVGALYMANGDDKLAFRFFSWLMEHHVFDIVRHEYQNLRKWYYCLERLLHIFLPDLAHHFKVSHIPVQTGSNLAVE
jgi:hypothetical protein